MAELKIRISQILELEQKAEEFLGLIHGYKIIAFYGDMGVGKTTFIKSLCTVLKVTDEVTSPTFAIVNEYFTKGDYKIYHFDLYRIKKEQEIYDFGYEEYFYGSDYCFIEWPEMAENLLPDNTLKVYVSIDLDGSRELKFQVIKNEDFKN